jgi:uncharacterized protein YjbJ (UPF0337 family)
MLVRFGALAGRPRDGISIRALLHRGTVFQILSTACRSLTGVRHKEQLMSMNRDQVKGRLKEAKGKIKEAAGKLVGNEKLEQKGKAQKILGEAQAKFGDVKKDVKEAVKKA